MKSQAPAVKYQADVLTELMPAVFYYIAEAMIEGGVIIGLASTGLTAPHRSGMAYRSVPAARAVDSERHICAVKSWDPTSPAATDTKTPSCPADTGRHPW
jgi:hypothetical protein